jgi:hypothetical protein
METNDCSLYFSALGRNLMEFDEQLDEIELKQFHDCCCDESDVLKSAVIRQLVPALI